MRMIRTAACKLLFVYGLLAQASCGRHTYPCPDIQGGTEVVKAGSAEGLKKNAPEQDANGRLVKKPYSHPGLKKKRK